MTDRENCEDKMDNFLKRCFYHAGLYNSEENFAELDIKLKEKEVICLYVYYSCFLLCVFVSAIFARAENGNFHRKCIQ